MTCRAEVNLAAGGTKKGAFINMSEPALSVSIRPASAADVPTLIHFIMEEAREAEGRTPEPMLVARGVEAAVVERAVAEYWVLEDQSTRAILGSTSVYIEWSDWYAAPYWWIQSFYLRPSVRGQGLSDFLIRFLEETAEAAGAIELRLYAHMSNHRALAAYRRAGFLKAPYEMLAKKLKSHGALREV